MLFMVIERFKNGDPEPVRERFKERGRMMPEGVAYISSWVTTNGATCYQVMAADQPELLDEWIANWSDIVDFEIVPVMTSDEFAAGPPAKSNS
jgi:hypothetical protein